MIKSLHTALLTALVMLFLMLLTGLSALSEWEAKEQVQILRQFLDYDPGEPRGKEITPEDIVNRKEEIRNEIRAILASTREDFWSYDISVLHYVYERGVLYIKDNKSGITVPMKVNETQRDIVSNRPNDFHLEAVRELKEDLGWNYYNWILKGPKVVYYEEVKEAINNIPQVDPMIINEPEADIEIYNIRQDQPAQAAIAQFEEGDSEALKYFEDTSISNNASPDEYLYWTAVFYIQLGHKETALYWLNRYLNSGNPTYRNEAIQYVNILSEQDRAFASVSVQKMPFYLSTPYGESHFVITPDGEWLYFSAYSESETRTDIWRAGRINNQWDKPEFVKELSSPLDEALCSFSTEGEKAYLMGMFASGKQDFDIYLSSKGTEWKKPKPIRELNSAENDVDPWVYDDYLLLFSSDRPGGFGGYDIYYSLYRSGVWQKPVNLGSGVNSDANETAPFLDWDGRTLYYSSDAPGGLGGCDLYKTVILDQGITTFSNPQNLGVPINSHADETKFYHKKYSNEAMVLSSRGSGGVPNMYNAYLGYPDRSGYYQKSAGDSLVWIWDAGATSPLTGLKPVEGIATPDLVLSGVVRDDNGITHAASVMFYYTLSGMHFSKTASANTKGEYRITLPWTESFYVTCDLQGFYKYSATLTPENEAAEYTHDIVLHPLTKDKEIILRNVQFAFDSADLLPSSKSVLDDAYITLLNNPVIKVEISGHTCNTGTYEYNMDLSTRRAKSVVAYLVKRGIDPQRLVAKGYGPTQPLNQNRSEEEKELNRRVQFKVLN